MKRPVAGPPRCQQRCLVLLVRRVLRPSAPHLSSPAFALYHRHSQKSPPTCRTGVLPPRGRQDTRPRTSRLETMGLRSRGQNRGRGAGAVRRPFPGVCPGPLSWLRGLPATLTFLGLWMLHPSLCLCLHGVPSPVPPLSVNPHVPLLERPRS